MQESNILNGGKITGKRVLLGEVSHEWEALAKSVPVDIIFGKGLRTKERKGCL